MSLQGELLGVSPQMWQELLRGTTLRVAVFVEVGCYMREVGSLR